MNPASSGLHRSSLARFPLGDDVVRYVTRDQQQLDNPSGAQIHAERLITTRLRTKAGAIRSGQEPPVLPSAPPEPAPMSRDVPHSATSFSCSRSVTQTGSVNLFSTTPGRLVFRHL